MMSSEDASPATTAQSLLQSMEARTDAVLREIDHDLLALERSHQRETTQGTGGLHHLHRHQLDSEEEEDDHSPAEEDDASRVATGSFPCAPTATTPDDDDPPVHSSKAMTGGVAVGGGTTATSAGTGEGTSPPGSPAGYTKTSVLGIDAMEQLKQRIALQLAAREIDDAFGGTIGTEYSGLSSATAYSIVNRRGDTSRFSPGCRHPTNLVEAARKLRAESEQPRTPIVNSGKGKDSGAIGKNTKTTSITFRIGSHGSAEKAVSPTQHGVNSAAGITSTGPALFPSWYRMAVTCYLMFVLFIGLWAATYVLVVSEHFSLFSNADHVGEQLSHVMSSAVEADSVTDFLIRLENPQMNRDAAARRRHRVKEPFRGVRKDRDDRDDDGAHDSHKQISSSSHHRNADDNDVHSLASFRGPQRFTPSVYEQYLVKVKERAASELARRQRAERIRARIRQHPDLGVQPWLEDIAPQGQSDEELLRTANTLDVALKKKMMDAEGAIEDVDVNSQVDGDDLHHRLTPETKKKRLVTSNFLSLLHQAVDFMVTQLSSHRENKTQKQETSEDGDPDLVVFTRASPTSSVFLPQGRVNVQDDNGDEQQTATHSSQGSSVLPLTPKCERIEDAVTS